MRYAGLSWRTVEKSRWTGEFFSFLRAFDRGYVRVVFQLSITTRAIYACLLNYTDGSSLIGISDYNRYDNVCVLCINVNIALPTILKRVVALSVNVLL